MAAVLVCLGLGLVPTFASVANQPIPTYRKVTLEESFFAEGATFGDLNNDGVLDAIAGPYWYAGPDFKERHLIYPAAPIDPHGYSENFFAFAYDFNRDGWQDVLVIGFPGAEAVWYENPGKAAIDGTTWKRHLAFTSVDTESPTFARLFPQQRPVLLCAHDRHLGYATFDPARPNETWIFHAITPSGQWQRFTHGLGFGDINGDGRNDIVEAAGWWEQPASLTGDPLWIYHPFVFAPERGGAQMYVMDVDGDGKNDVITAHNAHGYGLSWFEQQTAKDGTITFHEHVILSQKPEEKINDVQFSQPHALVIADVDNDGLPDLVTGKRWWAHGPEGDVDAGGTPVIWAFLLRRGANHSATFAPVPIDETIGVGTQLVTADVNADGFPDFVVANKRGSVVFLSTVNGQSGDAPDAKLRSPHEEQAAFRLPPGFEIQLVASEPYLQKPLNLNFDSQGRLWVTTTSSYPWPSRLDALGEPILSFTQNWQANQLAFRADTSPPKPVEAGRDSIRVLSDFSSSGSARTNRLFADGLNIPIGILPLPRRAGEKGDTVIAYSIPTIWRLSDTKGTGFADQRERLYTGFGFKDTHGMSSNYTYWVDGWIYGTHGYSNHSEIRDGSGQLTVLDSGNTYRFRADGSRFEQWTWGQTNPFGLSFDPRGDIYTADSHSKPVYLLQPGGFYEGISKQHDGLGFAPAITQDDHGSSAIAGITYYAATQFPEEYRGNLFNGNVVTRRVNRDRLEWSGSSPRAIRMPDFISSDDPSFRPVQIKLGPDGALWISDFYNPIIGHYEVPLTHPSRDFSHGRIWRVVWRGLDGKIPPPTIPNLTLLTPSELTDKLADDNLTVRTLATNELVDRVGSAAIPLLRALAAKVFPLPDSLAVGPVANALERLGASDDQALFSTLLQASDSSGAVALRLLANRESLGSCDENFFRELFARTKPGFTWRAATEVFVRHPASWQAPLLLDLATRTPTSDFELIYGEKLALKSAVRGASAEQLAAWSRSSSQAEAFLATVCLAVPQPAAAEFLLGVLERSKFQSANAGELARHAVQHLPPERYRALEPLVASLEHAPIAQRLALAEGLALAAADRAHPLPAKTEQWMQNVLTTVAGSDDWLLARRAVDASAPIMYPSMLALLQRLAIDEKVQQYPFRFVVVKTLPADANNADLFVQVLNDGTASNMIRKVAVDALGRAEIGEIGESALAAALPKASSDLALAIAVVLSKSDRGAELLLDQVAADQVSARVLVHGYVAPALAARAKKLQARSEELTRDLPSENARIDALIAARVMSYGRARPNLVRGAAIFTQQCAICHQIKGTGANIGPTLDGLASRGVPRVMEDILDPSRTIDPMFRLSTLTEKNGATQTGMNLQLQGDRYILNDLTGHSLTVEKAQVAQVTRVPTSLMPGAFETALSEEEFFDLVAFLTSTASSPRG